MQVQKLGPLPEHTDHIWKDSAGKIWGWYKYHGWQYASTIGNLPVHMGSFNIVDAHPPYTRMGIGNHGP